MKVNRENTLAIERGPLVYCLEGADQDKAVPYHAWANRGPGTMRVWTRAAEDQERDDRSCRKGKT